MMKRRFVHRRAWSSRLVLLSAAALAACDSPLPPDTDSDAPDDRPVLTAAIVSNPVTSVADASGAAGIALSRTATGGLVYVSLPPGSIPDGKQATLSSPRSGGALTVPMVDGGFDPVAVEADAGDTLALDVRITDADQPLRYAMVVPARVPPVVVRTDPPPKKRDVPLNATMLIVFSEPIDPATVTIQSVQLLRGGQPVSGTLELTPDGLRVEFTPDDLLAPQTDYVVLVKTDVADLGGDALAQSLQMDVTTGPSPVALVSVIPATTTVAVGASLRLTALVKDASGSILGDYPLAWVSDQPSVAAVSGDGLVTALSPGSAEIVASAGGTVGAARITVQSAAPAAGFELVFGSDRDATPSLYVVAADGSVAPFLDAPVPGKLNTWNFALSPDGQTVAFESGFDSSGTSDIYLLDVATSALTQLTHNTAGSWPNGFDWSPDGRRIAFAAGDDGNAPDIFVINVDGTALTRLTGPNPDGMNVAKWNPHWSPDGTKLVFSKPGTVAVMNADGSDARVLVGVTEQDTFYAGPWSPDGSKIVLAGRLGIAVVNADGSGLVRLADGFGSSCPIWSPDGAEIAFTSTRDGNAEIYVMNADGSGQVNVTLHPAQDGCPQLPRRP